MSRRKGRKPTTGRYETREELENWVRWFYNYTSQNMAQVAKTCRVSPPVVSRILDGKKS